MTLRAGEVLFVPRHWWHDVQTVSDTALSVNHWIALPTDRRERVKEALVALLATALLPSAQAGGGQEEVGGAGGWLNPGEEQLTMDEAGELLRTAVAAYDPATPQPDAQQAGGGPDGSREAAGMARVLNAFGTGAALEAAADAVLGIGPTAETVAAVTQLPTAAVQALDRADASEAAAASGGASGGVVVGQLEAAAAQAGEPADRWFVAPLPSAAPHLGAGADTATLRVEHLGGQECAFLFDEIFTRRAYLRPAPEEEDWLVLRDGATVVDCGANIGLFALFCVAEAARVRVVAVEPAPPCVEVLSRNAARYARPAEGSSASPPTAGEISVRQSTISVPDLRCLTKIDSIRPDVLHPGGSVRAGRAGGGA